MCILRGVCCVHLRSVYITLAVVCTSAAAIKPEQIHINLTPDANRIAVTFVTVGSNSNLTSSVQWREAGSTGAAGSIPASVSTYTAGGWIGLVHRAVIQLQPGRLYQYRCGPGPSEQSLEWSKWIDLKHMTMDPESVTIAIVADLDGREQDGVSTIDALNAAAAHELDACFHAGDIAYIKGDDTEGVYDTYFRQIEPMASVVPYHVAVGNQEHWNDFAGYNARFSMPGNNFWHSIDIGPVHALFVSTEHNYTTGSAQHDFIRADLQTVNRTQHPWLIVLLHRPLYCSTNDYYDCMIAAPKKLRPALEPLLLQHNVDAVVVGHVHNYERTAAVLNGTSDLTGPVHITVGNAGDIEGMTHGWAHPKPEWSLAQSVELGWSRWRATPTTLSMELVSSKNGSILDSFAFDPKC